MMRAYASAAGSESGVSTREGREFDINSALPAFFKLVVTIDRFKRPAFLLS